MERPTEEIQTACLRLAEILWPESAQRFTTTAIALSVYRIKEDAKDEPPSEPRFAVQITLPGGSAGSIAATSGLGQTIREASAALYEDLSGRALAQSNKISEALSALRAPPPPPGE